MKWFLLLVLTQNAWGMSMKIEDAVRSLSSESDGMDVTFMKHAAIYKLEKKNKNYSIVLRKLEASLSSKKEISLHVDPEKMILVD